MLHGRVPERLQLPQIEVWSKTEASEKMISVVLSFTQFPHHVVLFNRVGVKPAAM